MDFYKKKPLKYSHEIVSRDIRHTETLKARESSRFKRLSIIRNISQSDLCDESLEIVKPVEENQKVEQVPLSRLELMRKWKQEKALKKQLEAKSKVKPFYAGKNTISTSVQHEDKPALKFTSTSFTASRFAEIKFGNSVSKSVSSKASSIPSFPKKTVNVTSSTANHINGAARSGNIGSRLPGVKNTFASTIKASKAAVSSQKPKQESVVPKLASSKLPSKPLQKESAVPKFGFSNSKLPSKPLQKASAPSVTQKTTAYGKVQSKATTSCAVQKLSTSGKVQPKTPTAVLQKSATSGKVQPKTPTAVFQKSTFGKVQPKTPTAVVQKTTISRKIQSKESQLQAKNIPARKGFCFKKAVTDAHKQEADKKVTLTQSAKPRNNEKLETKPSKEESSISEKLENVPDLTFNCDVSLIKRKQSFAPEDFRFQPPSNLTDFMFEDDEDDPYAILEDFQVKYMSRTSTPSKKQSDPKESSSPSKNTPLAVSMAKKNLNDSSVKDLQTTNQDDPAISITREILEGISGMSCSMSPKVNDTGKLQETSLHDFNVNYDGNEKVTNEKSGDCEEEHMQSTSDEHSNYSEKLCEEVVKASNDKDSSQRKVEEDCTETANGGDGFIKETGENRESCDSPFDIVDLSKVIDWGEEMLDSMKLDTEKLSEKVELIEDIEIPKGMRKSSRISHKRVSMLKSVSKLNVIDENLEDEDLNISSCQVENSVFSPRRSVRLLHKHSIKLDSIKASPSAEEEKLVSISPFTPRRSLRLQNAVNTSVKEKEESVCSPCKVVTPKYATRHSLRLIDLNTPEKDSVQPDIPKSNLTADFSRMNLNEPENRDPIALLTGVENSPVTSSQFKTRKVSLLYSPIKGRKSIRKSIRGDLMSFSPSE